MRDASPGASERLVCWARCVVRGCDGGDAGENRVRPASRASGRGGVDECGIRFLLITREWRVSGR
jgi:hypothetical protein